MNAPARRRRYPGVHAFGEADAPLFYGRQAAADQLLLRVLSVRLLLQFAPSGVGKTSLLQAGLFPELRKHNCFPSSCALIGPTRRWWPRSGGRYRRPPRS